MQNQGYSGDGEILDGITFQQRRELRIEATAAQSALIQLIETSGGEIASQVIGPTPAILYDPSQVGDELQYFDLGNIQVIVEYVINFAGGAGAIFGFLKGFGSVAQPYFKLLGGRKITLISGDKTVVIEGSNDIEKAQKALAELESREIKRNTKRQVTRNANGRVKKIAKGPPRL